MKKAAGTGGFFFARWRRCQVLGAPETYDLAPITSDYCLGSAGENGVGVELERSE